MAIHFPNVFTSSFEDQRSADRSLSKNANRTRNEIGRGGVYGATAAILLKGNSISWKQNRFLADFTTGNRRFQVKSGRGGCGGGACSPVRQTVKNPFLTV